MNRSAARSALAALLVVLALAPALAAAQCPDGMRPLNPGRFAMAEDAGFGQVQSFCLDVAEVTVDEWAACIRFGKCTDANLKCSRAATWGAKGKEKHPVNCVSWTEADAYCKWQGKRLPTEAEFEWAARGQLRGWKFTWGNQPPALRACWDGQGNTVGAGNRNATCAVGSLPAGDSPDGIHDLAGNVREWTSSGEGRQKVVRGGSWGDSIADFLTASFRGMNAPDERFELTGFRCAADQGSLPNGPKVTVIRPPPPPPPARAAAPSPKGAPRAAPKPVKPAEEEEDDGDGIVVAPPDDPNAPPEPPPPPKPKPKVADAPPPKRDPKAPRDAIEVGDIKIGR